MKKHSQKVLLTSQKLKLLKKLGTRKGGRKGQDKDGRDGEELGRYGMGQEREARAGKRWDKDGMGVKGMGRDWRSWKGWGRVGEGMGRAEKG